MDTHRLFETPDLYLSAALVFLLHAEPSYKVINGKTFCCFPISEDLYRAMGIYNAGVPINAIEYAGVIRRLRAELIMRRNMEAGK